MKRKMKGIEEIIGRDAAERLKESYGDLVDWIGVEEQGPQVFKMVFQIFDWARMPVKPTTMDRERAIGKGVADLEYTLYRVLSFDDEGREPGIRLNYHLPESGLYMHPMVYRRLMDSEREAMRKIEERLRELKKDD